MAMRANNKPAEVFPPGEFLEDAMIGRGWTQGELAEIIGRPVRLINEIIGAKRAITPDTAHELAAALGTSAQYWMNLETAFQLSKSSPVADRITKEAALRERFPVREMMKRGWISSPQSYDELEANVFSFFGIGSASEPLNFNHAARRNYEDMLSMAQEAWLFRVRQIATALNVPKYSESRLRAALGELERLMVEPEEVRHVPRILSDCGVRFVIVEPIPGSKIDGVCFWIDMNRSPVIGLSLKGGDQIDRFWFNLRHEIEHVLRCEGRSEAVIDDFDDTEFSQTESERIANAAASDFCVPTAKMNDFHLRHYPAYSHESLVGFARLMRRHPGIVVGQIQKKLGRWDIFKKYQAKVRHIITGTAATDGYGQSLPVAL
jgi:HTH-type transcriptional regulator / antitoxin HigA